MFSLNNLLRKACQKLDVLNSVQVLQGSTPQIYVHYTEIHPDTIRSRVFLVLTASYEQSALHVHQSGLFQKSLMSILICFQDFKLPQMICDMIKGNESDVGNTDFELQAKRGDKFLCFTLFLKLKNCSYLGNQMSDSDGIWIKM